MKIWIEPSGRGLEPAYDQRSFPAEGRNSRWQLVVSPDGRDGSMRVHQDVLIHIADLGVGNTLDLELDEDRFGYLHVAFGRVRIGETTLGAGDAIKLSGATPLELEAVESSHLLFFDLA